MTGALATKPGGHTDYYIALGNSLVKEEGSKRTMARYKATIVFDIGEVLRSLLHEELEDKNLPMFLKPKRGKVNLRVVSDARQRRSLLGREASFKIISFEKLPEE